MERCTMLVEFLSSGTCGLHIRLTATEPLVLEADEYIEVNIPAEEVKSHIPSAMVQTLIETS